jgi:hypothetical protein
MSELYHFPPQSGPFYRPTVVQRIPQYEPPPPERLTIKRLFLHLTLLGLTALTTTIWGALWMSGGGVSVPAGLLYSFALLMILGAHEMGHYIACRWYGVAATLPFFIPSPLPLFGTFGAVIKIKSPIPSRRALFDIGIAGPLAGFVFAVPVAYLGHYFAVPSTMVAEGAEGFALNDPLLFKLFSQLLHLPPTIQSKSALGCRLVRGFDDCVESVTGRAIGWRPRRLCSFWGTRASLGRTDSVFGCGCARGLFLPEWRVAGLVCLGSDPDVHDAFWTSTRLGRRRTLRLSARAGGDHWVAGLCALLYAASHYDMSPTAYISLALLFD